MKLKNYLDTVNLKTNKMKLEQSIYNFILSKVGIQENVKGCSIETFRKMKRGKSGMTTTVLKRILEANEIKGAIHLKTETTELIIEIK